MLYYKNMEQITEVNTMQFKNLTPHEITILSESGITQDPQRKTFSAKSDEITVCSSDMK